MMLPLFALAFATSAASAGQSQQPSWSGKARFETEVGYNDNAFLLRTSRKRRLETGSAADSATGRYRDMESATDFVPRPSLELGLEGPGLGGRTLNLTANLAYEANLQNTRRRHAELGVRIAQSLGHDARLRFDVDSRPSYFHRNYFSDAVDLDLNGNIASRERIYAAGISSEVDVSAAYRRRLLRSTGATLLAELELGYFNRVYDAPFEGRNRRGPGAGVDLTLELGRQWTLGLDFAYQSLAADVTNEVVLIDETNCYNGICGKDLNLDGDVTDVFAIPVNVDRSRTEQEVGFKLEHELRQGAVLEVAFGRRRRSFGSEQRRDFVYRGRVDNRTDISVGLDVPLASGIHLMFGLRHAAQTTNRSSDGSTGDETDYTQRVVSAGLRYRL